MMTQGLDRPAAPTRPAVAPAPCARLYGMSWDMFGGGSSLGTAASCTCHVAGVIQLAWCRCRRWRSTQSGSRAAAISAIHRAAPCAVVLADQCAPEQPGYAAVGAPQACTHMLRTVNISGRRVHAPRQPWQRSLHAPRQLRCRSRRCSFARAGAAAVAATAAAAACATAAALSQPRLQLSYCTRAGAAAPTAMAAAVAAYCSHCTRHSNCCHRHGSGHWMCCMRHGSCCRSRGSGRCVARTTSCRQSHGRHGRVAVAAMAAAVTRATAAAVAAMAAVDACAIAAALSQSRL